MSFVPRAAIDVERIRLAARPVQREHQPQCERLVERVLRRQLVELADELAVPSEGELRVEALLERGQQDLLQPRGRQSGERLALEICERRPAPERQCFALQLGRRLGLAVRERLPGFLGQSLESPQVELLAATWRT